MHHIQIISRDIEIVQYRHLIVALRQRSDIDDIQVGIDENPALLISYLDILGDESVDLIEGTIGIPGIDISALEDIFQAMILQYFDESGRRIGQIDIEKLRLGQIAEIIDRILHELQTVLSEEFLHFLNIHLLLVAADLFPDEIYRSIEELPLPDLFGESRKDFFQAVRPDENNTLHIFVKQFVVQFRLHGLFHLLHIIGLIEHLLIQIFEIFTVDIGESKFITGNISDIAIREEGFGPSRSENTRIVRDEVRIIRIDDLQILDASAIHGDECE